MNNTATAQSTHQQPLGKSIILHVLPGLLVTIAFLVLKPLLDTTGFPPMLAFLLAILLVDIPFMLAVMFNEGKKLNGRFSLEGVVLYQEQVSWKTFAWVFVGAFIGLYLIITLSAPIDALITNKLFAWMPGWIFLDDATQYEGYAKTILVIVFSMHLLITGLILPWVEELYFRGYLLPRISRYGSLAPLIGGILFGLYHVWQLYSVVGVFILGAGLGYVVWWKKDIRLSISLHMFANVVIRLFLLMGILAM